MDENIRLFNIIESLKKSGQLTNYVELADILKTNKAGITDLKKSRKKISVDLLKSMKRSYPQINVEWILTGKGDMFFTNKNYCDNNCKFIQGKLPLIPYDGWAGLGSPNFSDERVEEYYIIPDFKDANFLLRVKGDSMTPLLESGDLVACKKVCELCDDKKIHAIYTKSMGVLIKHILRDSMPSHLTFKSENNNYPEFNLPVSDIVDIALVVGSISLARFSALK